MRTTTRRLEFSDALLRLVSVNDDEHALYLKKRKLKFLHINVMSVGDIFPITVEVHEQFSCHAP